MATGKHETLLVFLAIFVGVPCLAAMLLFAGRLVGGGDAGPTPVALAAYGAGPEVVAGDVGIESEAGVAQVFAEEGERITGIECMGPCEAKSLKEGERNAVATLLYRFSPGRPAFAMTVETGRRTYKLRLVHGHAPYEAPDAVVHLGDVAEAAKKNPKRAEDEN